MLSSKTCMILEWATLVIPINSHLRLQRMIFQKPRREEPDKIELFQNCRKITVSLKLEARELFLMNTFMGLRPKECQLLRTEEKILKILQAPGTNLRKTTLTI